MRYSSLCDASTDRPQIHNKLEQVGGGNEENLKIVESIIQAQAVARQEKELEKAEHETPSTGLIPSPLEIIRAAVEAVPLPLSTSHDNTINITSTSATPLESRTPLGQSPAQDSLLDKTDVTWEPSEMNPRIKELVQGVDPLSSASSGDHEFASTPTSPQVDIQEAKLIC